MPKNPKDRETLKNYFSDGALPTAQHYSELIDSMVTWKDDGFDKDEELGWRISALSGDAALMSFFTGVDSSQPVWTLSHGSAARGAEKGTMEFRPYLNGGKEGPSPPVGLSMTQSGKVGVATGRPDWTLDVDGTARMQGRIGMQGPKPLDLKADGEWKDVTGTLEGCHAFEIVAGVGGKEMLGRYALIHAIALNAYNPRNPILNFLFRRKRIKSQSAMFGSFADRLQLKWETVPETPETRSPGRAAATRSEKRFNRPYKLRIRTASSYNGDFFIRCYITRLWFDRRMQGSRDFETDRDGLADDPARGQ